MFITISGESAALTYLETKQNFFSAVCVSTVRSQLSLLIGCYPSWLCV